MEEKTTNTENNPGNIRDVFAKLSFFLALFSIVIYWGVPVMILTSCSEGETKRIAVFISFSYASTILALLCGIFAIINRKGKAISKNGSRMAKGGIIISGFYLFFVVFAILLGKLAVHDSSHVDNVNCANALRMSCISLTLYEDDFGTYPEQDEWEDAVNNTFPIDDKPVAEKIFDKLKLANPDHHYVYWRPDDSNDYFNNPQPILADAYPYHNGKINVVLTDGTVMGMTLQEFEEKYPEYAKTMK